MEHIPFEALRELWGHYVLAEGIHVKARPSVAYVYREPGAEDIRVHFETGVSVSAPPEQRGDPDDNPDEPSVRDVYEDFQREALPRAFYLVDEEDLLVLKAYPTRILRYDAYHENGQPMIEVNHAVAVNVLDSVATPLKAVPEKAE